MHSSILAFIGGSTGGGEILIILVVMLLLFGSKKLPQMARSIGKAMEEFRRASREVTDEIMRADIQDEPKPTLEGKSKSLNEPRPTAPVEDEPEAPGASPEPKPSPHAVNRDEATP